MVFPLYESEGKVGVLLTLRSRHLKSHPGQISFPGGVQEMGESLEETALREWEEEMGTPRSELEIWGQYRSLDTRTGYHITPFLAEYRGNFQFAWNEEVEATIHLPLSELWERDFYTLDFVRARSHHVYYWDLGEKGLLWGATAEIILRFVREFCGFEREPQVVLPNLVGPPFFSP